MDSASSSLRPCLRPAGMQPVNTSAAAVINNIVRAISLRFTTRIDAACIELTNAHVDKMAARFNGGCGPRGPNAARALCEERLT